MMVHKILTIKLQYKIVLMLVSLRIYQARNGSNSDIVLGRLHKAGRILAQDGRNIPPDPLYFIRSLTFFERFSNVVFTWFSRLVVPSLYIFIFFIRSTIILFCSKIPEDP